MKNQIEKNKSELWQEMKNICGNPISYSGAQRLVTCNKAYKILCEMYRDAKDHEDPMDHEADLDLTPDAAKRWVSGMENADGSCGAYWTMEKTEEVRRQHGITEKPLDFWVTMNMMYSDYCKVAEKFGVNTLEFYASMAKAFLEDPDAKPGKLVHYYKYIAG